MVALAEQQFMLSLLQCRIFCLIGYFRAASPFEHDLGIHTNSNLASRNGFNVQYRDFQVTATYSGMEIIPDPI